MNRKWTDNDLRNACKKALTKKEVILALGLKMPGGYHTINKYIKKLNIDISHFKNKEIILKEARKSRKTLTFEEIFCKNSLVDYKHVKSVILREGLLKYECEICHLVIWQGKTLSLHLDHINGDNHDHRIENLRLLCPNCHSQTDTYCGKNIKNRRNQKFCKTCNDKIYHSAKYCKKCVPKKTKINWPDTSEIIKMVGETNYCEVARRLGVSDNAVRKRIKKFK